MKRNAIHYFLPALLVGLIAMSGSRATAGEIMSSAAVNIGAAQYSGTQSFQPGRTAVFRSQGEITRGSSYDYEVP